jgi:hypothetical protein
MPDDQVIDFIEVKVHAEMRCHLCSVHSSPRLMPVVV